MVETAALLVDHVLPHRPDRQWVPSFPYPLRFLLANHPQVMGKVLGIVNRAISKHLINKAGLKVSQAHTGAVTVIQRFGSALNLNLHFHVLFIDGVFSPRGHGQVRFHRVNALTSKALNSLTKPLDSVQRHAIRQSQAVPLWNEFLQWATQIFTEGVAHGRTSDALAYLLKHQEGLQAYCLDARLPISNIKSEHVAKTIAVMRKFLFSDTSSGAKASARIFSVIETARANGHNPHQYLSVLLTELPKATCVEDVENLLPWNVTPQEVGVGFADYPVP